MTNTLEQGDPRLLATDAARWRPAAQGPPRLAYVVPVADAYFAEPRARDVVTERVAVRAAVVDFRPRCPAALPGRPRS